MILGKKARQGLLVVVYFLVVGWWIYVVFSNPELTQTQLVIAFWPDFLIGSLTLAGCMYIMLGGETTTD